MSTRSGPIKVFLSYAHEDRGWCDLLLEHMGVLVNSGQLQAFDDSQIGPGQEWDQVIKQELESADIILVILTARFGASKYATTIELPRALERHGARSSRVIPILADHCDWPALPISGLQAVPRDANGDLKPLVDWPNKNVPLASIAKSIRTLVEELQTARAAESETSHSDVASTDSPTSSHSVVREPAVRPPSRPSVARRVISRAGLAAVALLIFATIAWNWDALSVRFGSRTVTEQLPTPTIAPVTPEAGILQVFVARFLGDDGDEFQKLVAFALEGVKEVRIRKLPEVVAKELPDQSAMIEEGHSRAATILMSSGADGVLWGVLLKSGTTKTLQLYWKGKAVDDRRALGRYKPDETLEFPTLWSDVRRQVETAESAISGEDRNSVATQLVPFVDHLLSPEGAAPTTHAGSRGARVHFIDVGSGDAIWVQGPVSTDGRRTSVLIDGGPDTGARNRVPAYLASNGMAEGGRIDEIIVSHFHADHVDGLIEVLDRFEVGRIVVPYAAVKSVSARRFLDRARTEMAGGKQAALIVLSPNGPRRLDWGDALSVDVLSADDLGDGASGRKENNASIVIRMRYRNTSFLFMGDAEQPVEKLLLSRDADGLKSTVLKVGMHGSRSASTPAFLDAVRADILVVSVGRKAFGPIHLPHALVMERLGALPWGPAVLRTDLDDEAEGRDARSDEDHDDIFVDSDGLRAFAYQARVTQGDRRWVLVKTAG